MKIRSLILLVILALMLALSFSAVQAQDSCDGDVVTITFRHHWGGNRIPLMDEQVTAFEAANPCIDVETEFLPWDNRLENLLTQIAAGEPPDVTMFGRQDLPGFAALDAVVPIDSYMERDGITADMFIPAEFVGNQYNGVTYMLPQPTGGALNIVWYNKEHFREAGLDPEAFPETWEAMAEVGTALTQGEDGFLDRIGFNPLATGGETPAFIIWLNANGQDWISSDLRTVTINNEAGVQALEFMKSYTDDVNFGIEEVNAFGEMTGEFDQSAFVLGLASMDINGSWQLFQITDAAPDMDFGVAPVPYGPMGSPDRRGTTWGGWGYMIPKGSDNPDEAWELVKWLTTEIEGTGACWFLQQQQRPSPLVDCNGYERDGEVHPMAADILAVAALDHIANISPVQPQVNEQIVRMTEDVMFGDKSPAEALEEYEATIQEMLDEFWADNG